MVRPETCPVPSPTVFISILMWPPLSSVCLSEVIFAENSPSLFPNGMSDLLLVPDARRRGGNAWSRTTADIAFCSQTRKAVASLRGLPQLLEPGELMNFSQCSLPFRQFSSLHRCSYIFCQP